MRRIPLRPRPAATAILASVVAARRAAPAPDSGAARRDVPETVAQADLRDGLAPDGQEAFRDKPFHPPRLSRRGVDLAAGLRSAGPRRAAAEKRAIAP